jgi:hypothetical protein
MKYPLAVLALCTGVLAHAGTPVSHDYVELELGVIEPEVDPGFDLYQVALSGSWSLNQQWLLMARVTGVAADGDETEFVGSRQTLELGYRQPLSRDTDLVLTLGPASDAVRVGESEYEYDAGYTASVGLRFALAPQLEAGGRIASTRIDGTSSTTLRLQATYVLSEHLGIGAFFETEKAEGAEVDTGGLSLRVQF